MTSRSRSGQPEFTEVLAKLGVHGVWHETLQASYELLYMRPTCAADPWTACEELRQFLGGLPSQLDQGNPLSFLVGVYVNDSRVLDDDSLADLRRWYGWQIELYRLQVRLAGDKERRPSTDEVVERLEVLIFDELDPFLTGRLRSLQWYQEGRALNAGSP